MSFYDDLNNFVHNYPYTNYHEVVLDFLQKLVAELQKVVEDADLEHIGERLDGIDAMLTTEAEKIQALESASVAASDAIQSLRAITTAHTLDIEQIHSEIDGVIDQISEAVETLQDEMADITTDFENYKTVTDTAISNLNQAAFDPSQIVMSNMPFNFALSTLNGNKNGMRIVVDGSGSASDAIQWVDGGQYAPLNIPNKQKFNVPFKIPRFYSSGNAAHLVIPSIIPIKYGSAVNWQIYFYANRWIGATSGNTGICKVGPINFTDLLAEGGVQQTTPSAQTGCFNDIELFANESTGCYDLHIYNGRNNKYCWINDYIISSLMVLPVDLGNVGIATGIQKYFNLLNTYLPQTVKDIDNAIDSAVNEALIPVNRDLYRAFKGSDIDSLLFTPATGVTVVSNHSHCMNKVYSEGDNVYFASIYNIDLVVNVANLENNTTYTIGDFDISLYPISGSRTVDVAIESPNSGSFGSFSNAGKVAIKAYGTFGDSVRARITATITDRHIVS